MKIFRLLDAATVALVVIALALMPTRPSAPTLASASPSAEVTASLPTPERRLPSTVGTAAPSPVTVPAIEALRISVPRLDIDLPLAYGDIGRDIPQPGYAGNTPENVALVFPGSAPLAGGGNTYVYAHARVGMFLSLWNVRVGDEVRVYGSNDATVSLRYTVTQIFPRVSPSDTSWLDPSGPERLTLQTSTGPNAGDPRFIVIAVPQPARSGASPAP